MEYKNNHNLKLNECDNYLVFFRGDLYKDTPLNYGCVGTHTAKWAKQWIKSHKQRYGDLITSATILKLNRQHYNPKANFLVTFRGFGKTESLLADSVSQAKRIISDYGYAEHTASILKIN